MKVVEITKQSIKEAVEILRRGGTVIYPTETAYALGCDATNASAAAKIFKIKNRPKDKNLPVICATKKMAQNFFKLGKIEKELAKKYWPGSLTMVLFSRHCEESATRQSRCCNDGIATPSEGLAMTADSVAVRVSPNKITRALSQGLSRPIISTSANISGKKTLYGIKEIIREFANKKNQPDLILDAGKLPVCKPSTIIKIENNKIIILRQGETHPTLPPLG